MIGVISSSRWFWIWVGCLRRVIRAVPLRWAVVAWEGGADEAKEIAHMRVAFGGGDQVGLNKRKAFCEHLQAFMNYLAQG